MKPYHVTAYTVVLAQDEEQAQRVVEDVLCREDLITDVILTEAEKVDPND
jgi:hypothetical protein